MLINGGADFNNRDGISEQVFDYFCYVSRSKVDMLWSQLQPEQVEEIVEQVSREHDRSAEIRAGFSLAAIVKMFDGGITYGRRNTIQRERKIKIAYTEKLREVLLVIAAASGDIPSLDDAPASQPLRSLYYWFEGDCLTSAPAHPTVEDVVRIRSKCGNRQVLLDCSLRFFSEGPEADGRFLLHSGNRSFFNEEISLNLSGVIVVLKDLGHALIGTPLFLRLNSPNDLSQI